MRTNSKCAASLKDEEIVHALMMEKSKTHDKGLIQLAMRSGQFATINVAEVYEGEIKSNNRFKGTYEFQERTSDKVVGYMAYFALTNGFEKYYYMSVEECDDHATKYSKNYKTNGQVNSTSQWATNFDGMAKKTVLKLLLTKYAPLSIEMQKAVTTDQAVVKADVTSNEQGEEIFVEETDAEYVDNPKNSPVEENAPVANAEQEAKVKDNLSKIMDSASKNFESKETSIF